MLNSLKKSIRKADLFGVQLYLNVKQQDKYRSSCSGILSLTMVMLLSYIFVSSLISVLNREKYTLQIQSQQSRDPKYSLMNSENFMMAVQMTDPFAAQFPSANKTTYNYTVQQFKIQTMKNGTKVRSALQMYNLGKCTEKHFKNVNFEDQIQIESLLPTYLCLPLNYELYLQGSYNSEIFYYPKLSVQICTTDECYSSEQRQQVVSNTSTLVTVSTLIQSSIFMSNATENVLYQYVTSDFFLYTDFKTATTADLFFKQTKVLIDDNIVSYSGNIKEESFWSYDILNYRDFQNPTAQPDVLFQLNLRLSPEQEVITKTADKFDKLLSYIGGMFQVFIAVFGIIALQYNALALKLSLANSLYQFNIPERNENGHIEFSYDKLINYIQQQINRVDDLLFKLKQHVFQVVKVSNITKVWGNFTTSFKKQRLLKQQIQESPKIDQKISEIEFDVYSTKLMEFKETFIQKLIQKILETRHQLKLGLNFFALILMCSQCSKRIRMKRQLLIQCNKMIQKDLDIVNILGKIQQIEKLKIALLDEDQIRVLNYTPKPVVNVNKKYKINAQGTNDTCNLIAKANQQNRSRVFKKRIRYNKPQKFLKIYESYVKLKGQDTKVNQRLIEMLGATMEMIFEKYQEIQAISQKKGNYRSKTMNQNHLQQPIKEENLTTNQSCCQIQIFHQIPAKQLEDEEEIYFQEIS